ncbi:hypothetical protein ES332_A04G067000v1 [Gossypium tomentosum]|uniref:Secreted protein n=1 Tax=Gossypium tomentosum TaxID=34277 RepID=A0A5D2QVP7_GOSTO|nr:hypothetical protein ES332_A04G067000v1 [Gossypium tomentosum]
MASSKGFSFLLLVCLFFCKCGQRRGGQKVWTMVWDACLCTLRPAHGGSGARLVELGFELLKSFKIVGLGF